MSQAGTICRPYITLRNGVRIYAWQYGLQAFCFVPSPKKDRTPHKEETEKAESQEETA